MTTLADMTPGQRAQSIGMWADTPIGALVILKPVTSNRDLFYYLVVPQQGRQVVLTPKEVTPRFDLPRAWTPTGEPVKWEKKKLHKTVTQIMDDGYLSVSCDEVEAWVNPGTDHHGNQIHWEEV